MSKHEHHGPGGYEKTDAEAGPTYRAGLYILGTMFLTALVLTVLADMPGVDKQGVSIDLKDDQLTINGKVHLPEEKEILLHKEYEVGNYFRQFTLSDLIDRDKITAKMSDGVLTLTLPKAEKAVPKKIEVTVG